MSTLSLRKIKHDSSAVDNITLDSSGRVCVGSQDLSAFGRKFLVDGTGGFNNSTGTVGVGFSRGASNTYGYIGTGDWAVNGLSAADFGISSGATGALVFGTGAGNEKARIDNGGRLTLPYQPAFQAGASGSSVLYNTNVKIDALTTATLNRGSHYNTTLSRFVAPVSGVYFFSGCMIDTDGGDSSWSFRKNGSDIYGGADATMIYTSGVTSGWHLPFTATCLVQLSANDYVEIWTRNYSFKINGNHTWWNGYLVG